MSKGANYHDRIKIGNFVRLLLSFRDFDIGVVGMNIKKFLKNTGIKLNINALDSR